ncbi:LsmAD domain-containing protein [Trametes gibbosa]|nr:LsmAD domain-containing protein [Trametes gibbosa]
MATAARQSKQPRKGPDPARRAPAWGGRPAPTFSPGPANARLPNGNQQPAGAFPPLNGARPADNSPLNMILQKISGLTGTTVTIMTKTNVRLEGVVSSTNAEGDTQGVTLKDVKEISNPGAPLKEQFFVAVTNIQEWSSGPADAKVPNGADSFKTDTDISQKATARRERDLQAWQPEAADGDSPNAAAGAVQANVRNVDELTFGSGAAGVSWDQFAVNEKLFGVKAGFDEEAYTTKLDRNAPDFKEKERKAQQIANEIMGAVTSNPHIAEERVMNLNADGSSMNEEDKYGAVVRGANAYVPPGARKGTTPTGGPVKADVPKVAVNAPDGSAVQTTSSTPTASKVPSPAPGATATTKPADAVPAFRNFVSTEKDRLLKKKQALMKSEMDKRLSDLVSFSKSFKLNKPIPDDLVPILAKDEDKQRLIKEKTVRDAEDQRARSIGVSSTLTAAPMARPVPSAGLAPSAKAVAETARQMSAAKASASAGAPAALKTAPSKPGDGGKKISMVIQSIPPFKGKRASTSPGQPQSSAPVTNGGVKPAASPLSPNAANRLNVNASSFRPTAKASPFSPGGSPNPNGTSSTSSPKGKPAEAAVASPQGPPNPFFGTRLPKRAPPVHIKDDFNPFKNHKVIEAAQRQLGPLVESGTCRCSLRSNSSLSNSLPLWRPLAPLLRCRPQRMKRILRRKRPRGDTCTTRHMAATLVRWYSQ